MNGLKPIPRGNSASSVATAANTARGRGAAATTVSGAYSAGSTGSRNIYSVNAAAVHRNGANGNTESNSTDGVSTHENYGIASAFIGGLASGSETSR